MPGHDLERPEAEPEGRVVAENLSMTELELLLDRLEVLGRSDVSVTVQPDGLFTVAWSVADLFGLDQHKTESTAAPTPVVTNLADEPLTAQSSAATTMTVPLSGAPESFSFTVEARNQAGRDYGVFNEQFGIHNRTTVVIDEQGIVRDIYVEPRDFESHPVHALEVLAGLDG